MIHSINEEYKLISLKFNQYIQSKSKDNCIEIYLSEYLDFLKSNSSILSIFETEIDLADKISYNKIRLLVYLLLENHANNYKIQLTRDELGNKLILQSKDKKIILHLDNKK